MINLEKRLLNRLQKKIELHEPELLSIKIGFSIGYAISSKDNFIQIQDLLSVADINMYNNKFQKKMLVAKKLGFLNLPISSMRFIQLLMEKDIYTYTHSEKTAKYASDLAHVLHLPQDVVYDLYFAAWFHDIGKLFVPIHILRKPAPFSEEEIVIMRMHVHDSVQLVAQLNLTTRIKEIIKYHHEHWDGTGYPFQLQQKRIPLESRILHLVDAYSAMTINHLYKKALNKEEAIKEIQYNSGTQFDPDLVIVFIDLLNHST